MKTPEEYYGRRGCEHNIIKFIFLILMIAFFSCEKPKEEKTPCWTCTTVRWPIGMANNKVIVEEFETCDKGVMLIWDGKIVWGNSQMYSTTCK